MEPCVYFLSIYLAYCMEYVWTSSFWIGIFQRATQRARILLTDNKQSGGSCSVNYYSKCVEIMNIRRQAKRKRGHVVQIHVNVILYLSIVLQSTDFLSLIVSFWSNCFPQKGNYSWLPITRTLANSNFALIRTKIGFPLDFRHTFTVR